MVKKNNFIESLNLFNNKSGKKSYNGILIIAGILGVMFLMGVVIGVGANGDQNVIIGFNGSLHTAKLDNLSISEDVSTLINISINLSSPNGLPASGAPNITDINITLPSSINFTVGTNLSASVSNLYSTAWVRNLTNNNLTIGATGGVASVPLILAAQASNISYVQFNVTGYVPGSYTINVSVKNGSSAGLQENTYQTITTMINITINDSTAPYNVTAYSNSTGFSSISPVYRSYPVTRANISNFAIYVELNARDFYELGAGGLSYKGQLISTVNFTLYNGTAGVMNSTLITRNGAINDSFAVNFTNHVGGNNLSDDHYYVNVTTVNDSKGNINYTGLGFNITVDRTAPTITAAKASSSTSKQIVLDLTITDTTSGIAGKQCTATGGGTEGITMSGNTGTQTATQTGLGCSTAYTYTINCVDHSGNTGSKEVTVSTDTCSGGSSGTSGGGAGGSGSDVVGSASSSFWVLTYNEASTELSDNADGVSNNLAERYRVKVKIATKLYYVGVVDTTDTTAKINVTTTAQDKEATLSVGDVKKFDVNADDKYDLSVTLNGVDSTTGKADLSVIYVQEPVSAEDREAVEEQVGEEATTPAKSKAWIWIVVVLAVIVIVGAIFYSKKKTRFKNYGF